MAFDRVETVFSTHCCRRMTDAVRFVCDRHESRFDCPDALIDYDSRFNEYGLIVHDGGTSVVVIGFCPWCGSKLSESKREEWFRELSRRGFRRPRGPGTYRSSFATTPGGGDRP